MQVLYLDVSYLLCFWWWFMILECFKLLSSIGQVEQVELRRLFLVRTRLVFVPSSDDLGLGRILPRPPLPNLITEDFQRKIPNAIFTSNPCRLVENQIYTDAKAELEVFRCSDRIQYCTQEIVVYREDIVKKMCRNSIRCPSTDISNQASVFYQR